MASRVFSDFELFILLKEGNRKAYTEIYKRYAGPLYAHALKRIKDREEAKDIIQELFVNLWANKDAINLQGQLSGYLYSAVRNRVINVIARKEVANKYIDFIALVGLDDKDHSDHLIRQNQLAEIIEKEINFLPPKMREVFTLSRKKYLSHQEIANELNISELTVKKQISNALKILRSRLDVLIRCFFFFSCLF